MNNRATRGGRWWVRQAMANGAQERRLRDQASADHARAVADYHDADGIGGDSGTGRPDLIQPARPTSADPIAAESFNNQREVSGNE